MRAWKQSDVDTDTNTDNNTSSNKDEDDDVSSQLPFEIHAYEAILATAKQLQTQVSI
jgi:hypothetical protein